MISDGIRKARKAAGITQEELAKELGINRATISKYESGAITPSIQQLCNIAVVLQTDVGQIMGGEFTFQRLMEISNSQALNLTTNARAYRVSLLASYDELNEEGQRIAVERVEELTEIPRYRAETAPQSTQAPPEGKETTPPPDAPETPPEGK